MVVWPGPDWVPSLRIHFIIDSAFGYDAIGRDNWLYNIALRLQDKGCEITIHTRKTGKKRMQFDIDAFGGVMIRRYGLSDDSNIVLIAANKLSSGLLNLLRVSLLVVRIYGSLRRNAREGDVVFSLNPIFEPLPGIMAKRSNRVRTVCLMKGRPATELTRFALTPLLKHFYFWMERYTLVHSDLVLANGYDTQEYIIRNYGVRAGIAYNGADLHRFGKVDLEPEGLGDAERQVLQLRAKGLRIILLVGTLEPRKGIGFLLEAAKRLQESPLRDFRVIIVAKGRRGKFDRLAKRLHVEECVSFLGLQSNIPFFLHAADVTVHLTYGRDQGGMSHATLEAMAAGRPIVAWQNSTYSQILVDGKTALLVEEGNTSQLSEAIRRLLDSEHLRHELGTNARLEAQKYGWDSVSARLLEDLSALVGKGTEA